MYHFETSGQDGVVRFRCAWYDPSPRRTSASSQSLIWGMNAIQDRGHALHNTEYIYAEANLHGTRFRNMLYKKGLSQNRYLC